jgi:RNA polymerase sigma-70 factor (ECF subfamily)
MPHSIISAGAGGGTRTDDAPNALAQVEDEERSHWIEACIERLPPEQRQVLLLRHDGELTFREIAEITDCSINTALGRMRYALNNLRRMMVEPRNEGLVRAD